MEGAFVKVRYWSDLYEPPERYAEGDGPLRFVMLYTLADRLTASYRIIIAIDPNQGLAAFGLFSKLLEMVGKEPRAYRDGLIWYRDRPATTLQIAAALALPHALVAQLVDMLAGDDVRWLDYVPPGTPEYEAAIQAARLRATTPQPKFRTKRRDRLTVAKQKKTVGKPPDADDEPIPAVAEPPQTGAYYTGTGQALHKDIGTGTPDPSQKPKTFPAPAPRTIDERLAPESGDSLPADSVRRVTLTRWTHAAIAIELRIPADGHDPRSNSDHTTIKRALIHATHRYSRHPTVGQVKEACRRLLALARDKGSCANLHTPIAAWTTAVQREFGDWTESQRLNTTAPAGRLSRPECMPAGAACP
jgi:hypothetical protein